MQTYQDIIETLEYEWPEISIDYSYPLSRTLDTEATARRIWRYLAKDGSLRLIRAMPEQWQRSEYTHLSVLDWCSSYEPITIKVCPNNNGSFDCNPFCALCAGDQEIREN
jgi:hypothetical protein